MSSRHLHEEWRVIVYDNINGYQSTRSVWCMWSSFCLNCLIYFATSTLIYQISAAQWSLNAGERGGGDSFNCEIIHNQYVLFIHIRPHLPLAWIYVSTWTAVPPHPDIRSWTYFPVPGYLPVSLVQAMCWQESDFSHHSIIEWKTFELNQWRDLLFMIPSAIQMLKSFLCGNCYYYWSISDRCSSHLPCSISSIICIMIVPIWGQISPGIRK